MTNDGKALAYGLSAVLLWSTVASAFKLSLEHLSPLGLLFYSALASVMVLAVIVAAQGKLGLLRSMPAREILIASGLGVLNPFLYYVILFKAYDLLPAQEAQPLNYTWAITLSLLSIPLLKQKMRAVDFLAIFTSYLGVVVISTQGNPFSMHFTNPAGVALALVSTIIWALYWIYNTKSKLDPVVGLLVNFLAGLPLIAIAFFSLEPWAMPGVKALLGAGYVGVFEMGLTFVLWLSAMKATSSSARVANLIFLSPFLSLVFIHFLVGEDIRLSTLAGLGFIVAGNVIQQFKPKRAG